MTDFHRNIFSYYRGALQPERDREQQLEDNTTKALVNTLEHCESEVAAKFLEWIGILTPRKATFVQQKGTIGDEKIRRKSQRLLLAIVGTTNKANQSVCSQLPRPPIGDSRPDAWLYGDDFVVLLESKTGTATLDLDQMASHWDKLRPTRRPKIVTWAEVHRFFTALMSGLSDTKSKWLVEEFTQYLEWTGMTEFVGFREEMFEFFVAAERNPDTKAWVRGAVESLGDRVLAGKDGLKKFNKFYSDKHVGNFGQDADHYWVAFGPADFPNWAHQTVSLNEQNLIVFVNVELLPAIRRLRKKMKGGGFRQAMCSLPAPFTVRIEERRKTKQPRVFKYFPIAEVETGKYGRDRYGLIDFHSPGFDFIEKLVFGMDYPNLMVRRSISRKDVLKLSKQNGDALVAEVLKILKAFHPIVEFVNE